MFISPIEVGSPQFMFMYEEDRRSRIEQAIVDIRSCATTTADISRILRSYDLSETTLSQAEVDYINKMINY
jgi:hypothetical protein